MPTVVLRVDLCDYIWLNLASKHKRKGSQELDRKWSGGYSPHFGLLWPLTALCNLQGPEVMKLIRRSRCPDLVVLKPPA